MSKPKIEDLRDLLFELNLISEPDWSVASQESKDSQKSIWKYLISNGTLTQKQGDTLEMCQKGYIPIKVARVTVSMNSSREVKIPTATPLPTRQRPNMIVKKPAQSQENKASKYVKEPSDVIKTEDSKVTESSTPVQQESEQSNRQSTVVSRITTGDSAHQTNENPFKSSETNKRSSTSNITISTKSKTKTNDKKPNQSSSRSAKIEKTDLSYLVGKKLGKFQLSAQLGKGSAGTVFLAHHTALNMPVAIKVLDPALASNYPEIIDRFMLEARSAARINHPNVVRVLDCDHIDGHYMIVMEYVDGISLSELIHMNGALSEDRALKYALAVAEGLEAALKVGIIHRDIKPANILVTKTKQVRIADMGLARAITGNSVSDTVQGVGLGTPQYFPPEQARDASSADCRSDIYALGITLYVLITGELPYKGKSLNELIRQHEEEYAIPINVLNPSITQRTTNVVIKMMQKLPADRYQSYEDLIPSIQACVVECQTRTEDLRSGSSRNSVSILNKLSSMFKK